MARADDARVSFGRELRAGKRIEFGERLSGYEIDDQTLSLDDSIALSVGRPPPPTPPQKNLGFWSLVGRPDPGEVSSTNSRLFLQPVIETDDERVRF
jgi:hypothetical protein